MTGNAARNYLARVRRALTCAPVSRRRLLVQGAALVEDFCQENPEAEYGDLVSAFGPPRDFAGEMLSTLDEAEVLAARRRRTWLRRGAVAIVALVLVLATAFWYTKWSKARDVINGDFFIVEQAPQKMTEEEFNNKVKESGG